MTSALLFITALAILVVSRKSGHSIFSPWGAYAIGQFLTAGIAFLGFHKAMTGFSLLTWIVYLLSAVAFLAGCYACWWLGRPVVARVQCPRPQPNLSALLMFSALILAHHLAGFVRGYLAIGGWPIFAAHPEEARAIFNLPSLWASMGISFVIFLLPLASWMLFFVDSRPHRILAFAMICLLVPLQILSGIRNALFFWLIFTLSIYDIGKRRIPVATLALVGLAFLAAFIGVAFFRARQFTSLLSNVGVENLPFLLKTALEPFYVYIANAYWNLDHALSLEAVGRGHATTWGASLLEGVFSLPRITTAFHDSYGWDTVLNESIQKISGLNSVPFQWPMYKDFGLPGVVVLPFLTGTVVTSLYKRCISLGSHSSLIVYSYFIFPVLFSFFMPYTSIPSYLIVGCFFVLLIPLFDGSPVFSKPTPSGT